MTLAANTSTEQVCVRASSDVSVDSDGHVDMGADVTKKTKQIQKKNTTTYT